MSVPGISLKAAFQLRVFTRTCTHLRRALNCGINRFRFDYRYLSLSYFLLCIYRVIDDELFITFDDGRSALKALELDRSKVLILTYYNTELRR